MRALLLRLLWRAVGPVPAFAVAALVFAALHLANPAATPLAGATVAAAGLMFCALYALTGRLWVPIGLHLAWNFAQGYLFGATVSGGTLDGSILLSTARPGAPVWLTGGTFGPEASVFALILVTAVTAAALALARQTGHLHRPTPTRGCIRPRQHPQLSKVSGSCAAAKTGLVSRSVPGRSRTRTASLVRKPLIAEKSDNGARIRELISSSRRSASSDT